MRLQKGTSDRQTDGIRNCGATNSGENADSGRTRLLAFDGAEGTPSDSVATDNLPVIYSERSEVLGAVT